jgi:hypothetical protein
MDPNLLIALAIVVLLLVVGRVLIARHRRTGHLAYRFGPEDEREARRERRLGPRWRGP